jgi:hypothetical protein
LISEHRHRRRLIDRKVSDQSRQGTARQAPLDGGFDQIGCEKGERDRHDAGLILSCRPSGLLDQHIRSLHALRPVGEALPPLADLRPASIGLPKNGDDGRVGEARRITFAVINVADNVRGELSAHVIAISELNRKKIARPIECVGCNWSSRSAVRRAPDGPQVNAERARSHKFEGEAGMTFTPAFMSRIADGLEIAGGAAVIVLSQDLEEIEAVSTRVHDESASSPPRFGCPSLT